MVISFLKYSFLPQEHVTSGLLSVLKTFSQCPKVLPQAHFSNGKHSPSFSPNSHCSVMSLSIVPPKQMGHNAKRHSPKLVRLPPVAFPILELVGGVEPPTR